MRGATPDGEPFRITDAGGAGLSPWSLRRRHRMLFHGVYLDRECPLSPHLLAKAALMAVESGSYLSHQTAARLWNGIVPDKPSAMAAI